MDVRLFLVGCLIVAARADWRSDILTANGKFMTAFEAGNFGEIKKLFATSSEFFSPDSEPPLLSSEGIKNWFQEQQTENGIATITLTTADVVNLDSVANEWGSYSLVSSSGSVDQSGSYLTTWKNTDGQVKITMMMWAPDK